MTALMLLFHLTAYGQSSAGTARPGSEGSGQANPNAAGEQGQQNFATTNETPPLMGAKEFGPGSTEPAPSYLIPSFQWSSFADSNAGFVSGQQEPFFQGSAAGNLTLQHVTRNTQFNLNYGGGTQFYNQKVAQTAGGSGSSYETFHRVRVGESISLRRWQLFWGDEASYLPESPWGFTGFGGLQSFNGGLGGAVLSNGGNLNPLLQPDQSILTFLRRLSNTSIGQLQYDISPRTSATLTGSYGILHFSDSGFDENDIYLLGGFTHALDRRNYVGVNYREGLTHFSSSGEDFREHGVLLSYGHRFLGRLSFELSGGPSVYQFTTGGSSSQVNWTTFDSLQYRRGRTDLGTSFDRRTTGGSGVLRGAERNMVEAHIGRLFFRTAYLRLDMSYSRNQSLAYATEGTPPDKLEGWGGGISLSRELGSHLSFYIQYYVQRQNANAALCETNRCGTTFFRQVGGIGLNWHTRPIRLQ